MLRDTGIVATTALAPDGNIQKIRAPEDEHLYALTYRVRCHKSVHGSRLIPVQRRLEEPSGNVIEGLPIFGVAAKNLLKLGFLFAGL